MRHRRPAALVTSLPGHTTSVRPAHVHSAEIARTSTGDALQEELNYPSVVEIAHPRTQQNALPKGATASRVDRSVAGSGRARRNDAFDLRTRCSARHISIIPIDRPI